MMKGKIVKGIAGFYYVQAGSKIYECKAKGLFRKDGTKPLVGDDVEIVILDEEKAFGNIEALLPRRSVLIRPAVANVDQALVVFSIVHPKPNFNLLDRFLIMMERQGLPCIICFNKHDIDVEEEGQTFREIYEKCGYMVVTLSTKTGEGLEDLRALLRGKTTTVAGPSGVGKSSLVNCLSPEQKMETGGISEKIERGKHTTRHTEILRIAEETYILDTPGFSSLSLFDIEKEELGACYPEFAKWEKNCRFAGCSHVAEPVCGVKDALKTGDISQLRYDNYLLLYEELKNRRRYS